MLFKFNLIHVRIPTDIICREKRKQELALKAKKERERRYVFSFLFHIFRYSNHSEKITNYERKENYRLSLNPPRTLHLNPRLLMLILLKHLALPT